MKWMLLMVALSSAAPLQQGKLVGFTDSMVVAGFDSWAACTLAESEVQLKFSNDYNFACVELTGVWSQGKEENQ